MKKIKWGCIQPLTGGMYIGARNAIGHAAEWILSYKGLDEAKTRADGSLGAVGNEYSLLKWCEKRNELPVYKIFNRKTFDTDMSTDVDLLDAGWNDGDVDFNDIDIVVSVPVCSGLSKATIANDDTKIQRNCNMLWNEKYALEVVKPKVYIFENAPTLFTAESAGEIRNEIEDIAYNNGYCVAYYRTDTKYHDNCQRRQRTFVIIFKNTGHGVPKMSYEYMPVDVKEFFERIPEDASQNDEHLELSEQNKMMLEFMKAYYGDKWREQVFPEMLDNLIKYNLWNEYYDFVDNYDTTDDIKKHSKKLCDHIQYKLSLNKNYYALCPLLIKEDAHTIPTCMFKAIPTLIHYKYDRLLTTREWLSAMGHPLDYYMYGDINVNYPKLGQNVPVRTAQWIVSDVVRILNGDNVEYTNKMLEKFDNVKYCREQEKQKNNLKR